MDDYSMSSLSESKNVWCARLVDTLTPGLIDGLKSIFKEALELCEENDETNKYLMTFQTFLSRIPKWNDSIIGKERERIETITKCGYLEELITCVHVIQLKALSCVRVGQKQKKIDINIPSADVFIHNVYINIARKLYTNVYLFETDLPPLELQKNNRQLEVFVQESILNTIRDTMPIESILRAYMDETEEEEVDIKEEIIEEAIPVVEEDAQPPAVETQPPVVETQPPVVETQPPGVETQPPVVETQPPVVETQTPVVETQTPVVETQPPVVESQTDSIVGQTARQQENISFSNTDKAQDSLGNETLISAPKTIERLEQIALESAQRRRDEADEDEDEDEDRITIGSNINIDTLDIDDLNKSSNAPLILDDIEILS
jgi:hypothetical protein